MIGYPCMNRTLRECNPEVRANRGLQKKTLDSKGLDYVSQLVQQNLTDLLTILEWNTSHDIYFYRCSSNLIPWNSEYELDELPDSEYIFRLFKEIGDYIQSHNIRFTFHPDHFVKLASPSEETVSNSIEDLLNHGKWLDSMGLDRTPFYSINIHIGAHYSDKTQTKNRFIETVNSLPDTVKSRLTVENDDKESLWGVSELAQDIHPETGIPVVFDYHHHQFTSRGLSYKEGFTKAKDTWGNIEPITHYSEPAYLYGVDCKPQKHANTIQQIPRWLLENSSVMVEAGDKEQAILEFL